MKKNLSNFGNAGTVEMLIKNSIQKAMSRKKSTPGEKVELLACDISNTEDKLDPLSKLDHL